MFYPIDPSEMYGVFAIRLEKYKAHFYTQGSKRFTCTSSYFNIKAQAAFLALFFFLFLMHQGPSSATPPQTKTAQHLQA